MSFVVPDTMDILFILSHGGAQLEKEASQTLYNQALDNLAVLDWLRIPTDDWKETLKVMQCGDRLLYCLCCFSFCKMRRG